MTDARGQAAYSGGNPELPGYQIERQLGRGSMGVVYLAEDLALHRKVALKILAPTLADDELFRRRFDRESQSAANLDHPNIVPVYAAGEIAGSLYIAMRYVGGGDLRTLLETSGPLGLDQTISIMVALADALDAAHAQDMIHRDVKPANILIDNRNGQQHYYLSDFGITKIVSSGRSLTSTGQIVGTIDYISPEQIQGKPVDRRADLYALGCVLYQCLTGVVPFPRDDTAALMWAHVHEDPPPVSARRPDLPAQIDAIVARAMAKQPEDRYSTCRELAFALRAFANDPAASLGSSQFVPFVPPAAAGKAVDTPPPLAGPSGMTSTYLPPRPAHARKLSTPPAPPRKRWWMVACGVLALALVGGSAAGVLKYYNSRFPNAAEQELLNEVPLALTSKNSCIRNSETEQDPNVAASVVCSPSDGDVNKVVYTKFTSPRVMDRRYQAAVATAGIGESSGNCLKGDRAEGTYNGEANQSSGRALCYQDHGSSFIVWTDAASHILVQATRVDPDYQKVRNWWAGVVGLKLPTTSTSEPAPAPATPPAAAAPAPPQPEPAPQPEPPKPAPGPDASGPAQQAGDNSNQGQNSGNDQSGGQDQGSGQSSSPEAPSSPPESSAPSSPPDSSSPSSPSSSPPSKTTAPTTSQTKPPPPGSQIKLDGPAPAAPSKTQGGPPVAGTGGCTALAGSFYSCNLTGSAPAYLPGTRQPRGQISGSQSAFVCQSSGSKYSLGKRTNHWWAWVGAGRIGVWVPTLFLTGGKDNAAQPGLPVCGSASTTTPTPTTTAPPPTTTNSPTHPVPTHPVPTHPVPTDRVPVHPIQPPPHHNGGSEPSSTEHRPTTQGR
jgi:serine/threonine protein kinase